VSKSSHNDTNTTILLLLFELIDKLAVYEVVVFTNEATFKAKFPVLPADSSVRIKSKKDRQNVIEWTATSNNQDSYCKIIYIVGAIFIVVVNVIVRLLI
jgi:hypothetical protein